MIMKKTILLSIILAVNTITLFSQTKQESIKELIHLMQTDSMVEKTFAAIVPTIMTQFSKEYQDSTMIATRTQHMNSILTLSKKMFNKILNEDVVALYDKFYTENEIKDIIVFYKSPTGKKLIEKMPEMEKEIMGIVMQKFMPEMKKNIQEMAQKKKNETTK